MNVGKVIFSVGQQTKYRNFQWVLLYSIYTHAKKENAPNSLVKTMVILLGGDPGWRKQKKNETIKLYCTVFLKTKQKSNKKVRHFWKNYAEKK